MNVKEEKHIPYFVLLEALHTDGCPVCNLIQKQVSNYFETLLYSGITSVPFQSNFNKTDGFCNRHTYQFADYHDGLAVALTYKLMLSNAVEHLEKKEMKQFQKKRKSQCLVCDIENSAEKRYLYLLSKYVYEPDIWQEFYKSDGLCIPHFQMYIQHYKYKKQFYEFHTAQFRKLLTQVQDYIDTINYTSENHKKFDKDNIIWKKLVQVLYGYRR